ncbi:MAG TPA: DNA/RNA non-specific endonuclease, partial [Dysgonamonadaceae bacterium]|nr:DNA/RNA non-specific endonuclease [Dysgonamonadaceae bacterium]
ARHSRWIAFTFYDKTAKSPEGRSNAWAPDPKLAEWTNNTRDYLGSGYDRGHLMASADRLYSRVANEQTFYYSNITSQNRDLNSGIWLELENTLRNYWGRSNSFRDTLYVVKGATIRNDQINGTIGENKIVVPKYNYMAVLSKKADTYKSIAFWFENRRYNEPYKLKEHALSVAELEEKTGIDFFHNLPDEIESVVEKQKRISDWPGL